MVDTDFKAPHRWNGWNWWPKLFPDPRGFLRWAHGRGIAVGLNTHPSITTDDLAEAERRAGRASERPHVYALPNVRGDRRRPCRGIPGLTVGCKAFDWARAGDQAAYMGLHEPFEDEGSTSGGPTTAATSRTRSPRA